MVKVLTDTLSNRDIFLRDQNSRLVYAVTSTGKFIESDRLNLVFGKLQERGFQVRIIDQRKSRTDPQTRNVRQFETISLGNQWNGVLKTGIRPLYFATYYLSLILDRFFYARSINHFLKRKKDYVLFVGSAIVPFFLMVLNPPLRRRIVVHCFDASLPNRKKSLAEKVLNRIEAMVYNMVSGVVAEDMTIKSVLERQARLPRSKVTFLGAIVDSTYWSPSEVERVNHDQLIIFFHARIVPRKGIEYLLDAVSFLVNQKKIENLKVLIVGPGKSEDEDEEDRQYLTELIRKAETLGISNKVEIIFGWQTTDAIRDFYNRSDIYVLPTLMDASPNTIRQAMAMGKPVITSTIGGRALITDGLDGFTVEPANSQQLAARLEQLTRDPNLRINIGQRARQTALSKFGADTPSYRVAMMLRVAFGENS